MLAVSAQEAAAAAAAAAEAWRAAAPARRKSALYREGQPLSRKEAGDLAAKLSTISNELVLSSASPPRLESIKRLYYQAGK